MVIFEDLQKLLLYQRLNLGHDCRVCKKKFYNTLNYLDHTRNCKSVSENLTCPKCGKAFGNQQIFHLHMKFHNNIRDSSEIQGTPECIEINDSDSEGNKLLESSSEAGSKETESSLVNQTETAKSVPQLSQSRNGTQTETDLPPQTNLVQSPKKQSSHRPKAIRKTVTSKKKIGLTKVKFEDCLRCDDCSCIYIDERDYYKHMRNFHQIDVATNMPIPQQRTKRKCRSCCKQCRGGHCNSVKRPRATQLASNLIFKINMRDNIKNRWTKMVSQQLSEYPILQPESEEVEVKPDVSSIKMEPNTTPDLSHLLSQVEVKIKTEPTDDYT